MNALLNRISVDPEVCGGTACIRGTRIWVSLILDLLADDIPQEDILREYPQLTHDDLRASLAYGAETAREQVITVAARTV